MKSRVANICLLASLCLIALESCHRKKPEQPVVDLPGLPPVQIVEDKILNEIWQFAGKTRSLYNASRFDELEGLASQLRAEHGRFGNGSWKLRHFYEALRCREEEPESMWQRHETIHQNWEAAKPSSITAYVAHADFLIEYAWHARGQKFADKVTKQGWRLFEQRLAQAKQVLDASASFEPKCPMWWSAALRVALGQAWNWDDFEKLFQEAKAFDPQFWWYDIAKANYLLPRWYGQPGDWEYGLSLEINRQGGLAAETYARVVDDMSGYYDNVFRESKASWPLTRDGFELMRHNYPESLEILSAYARLAVLADDRALARKLFDQIGGRMLTSIWQDQDDFRRLRNWAYSQ